MTQGRPLVNRSSPPNTLAFRLTKCTPAGLAGDLLVIVLGRIFIGVQPVLDSHPSNRTGEDQCGHRSNIRPFQTAGSESGTHIIDDMATTMNGNGSTPSPALQAHSKARTLHAATRQGIWAHLRGASRSGWAAGHRPGAPTANQALKQVHGRTPITATAQIAGSLKAPNCGLGVANCKFHTRPVRWNYRAWRSPPR